MADGSAGTGRRRAQVGGELWFGDVRRMLFENLLSYGGRVWLVTITAPGVELLPWDESGRYVQWDRARAWNKTAPQRWSELHRRAQQATKRNLGTALRSLAGEWQMQKRGVLHRHLVLAFGAAEEQAAARHYVAELRARTAEFGFGYVDARDRDGKTGRSTVMEAGQAAHYLSRYLGGSQLAEAIALELEERPRRLVWVSPSLTGATGCTMRRLRRARYLHVLRTVPSSAVFQLQHVGRLPAWFRDRAELVTVQRLARLTDVVPAGP